MKTLYLECSMGAAGDMLAAALYELVNDKYKKIFLKEMNLLGLNNVKVIAQTDEKCSIKGTKIHVSICGHKENEHNHENTHHCKHHSEHNHINLKTIESTILKLKVSKNVKNNALNIYTIIAQAEAKAHGKAVTKIHFHEVGEIDAIVDIVGVCLLIERLSPEEIIASPINIGKGHVHCAHGILPVPAPATAHILRNIPVYTNDIKGELCTPTGAAIIKYFANRFGQMPVMNIKNIGYGMGTHKFEIPNCVCAFLGESNKNINSTNNIVVQLQCNMDDITGESLSFVLDLLLNKGALDVFYTHLQMKKNRPGILLTCICNIENADFFARLILEHTTTFGVRKTICDRYILNRKTSLQKTPYGNVCIKIGEGFGIRKLKSEFEDIAKIASLKGITFDKVKNTIKIK
ncbi:MAG: nickel pincer cofactor biosynthesis protein LarC [Endomicrobium sp.]|nr:nickel pincer cofactor biosynthesis protein LarC [Endomicrobium sp.]MDR2399487.1 nickel pincer cofactor biosynthesis protein LarC [Endomicrobium sp.]